jgi:predicted component of type VI protein secretion system
VGDNDWKGPSAAKQSSMAQETRQRQLDAIDRLAAMEPLPVPESLSKWNREYSRLKVGEAGQHDDDQPSPSRPQHS